MLSARPKIMADRNAVLHVDRAILWAIRHARLFHAQVQPFAQIPLQYWKISGAETILSQLSTEDRSVYLFVRDFTEKYNQKEKP